MLIYANNKEKLLTQARKVKEDDDGGGHEGESRLGETAVSLGTVSASAISLRFLCSHTPPLCTASPVHSDPPLPSSKFSGFLSSDHDFVFQ